MSVQLQSRPTAGDSAGIHSTAFGYGDELDMDLVDRALDRGDLETVRRLLGLSQPAWRLLLACL